MVHELIIINSLLNLIYYAVIVEINVCEHRRATMHYYHTFILDSENFFQQARRGVDFMQLH